MLRSLLCALVLMIVLWGTGTKAATFDITFIGTAPDAQANAAVEHAADIWAGILVSDVPIKVRVAWFPLGAGTLGITFPNGRKDFVGAPVAAAWYPTALANAITGSEQNPGENDIDVFLNNGLNIDWYTGVDGNTGGGQYDLVSVALHELGHGLGFVGLAKKDDADQGSFGLLQMSDFAPLTTSFPWPQLDTLPGIFDRFLQAPTLEMLVDVPNPSFPLGSFFTCNQLKWNGPQGLLASGGAAIRIYSPGTFALGSSCVHLNESTYPNSNPNELMTPFSSPGDANHWPGPICIGILADIGWTIAPDVGLAELRNENTWSVHPNPAEDRITLRGEARLGTSITIRDAQGRIIRLQAFASAIDIATLQPGTYLLQVDGSVAPVRFVKY
ncbi:MAG: T9SS type A sorting domain-containing protein [Flavobacteriales bacterium]|nr:T9SS type A sorting domain-containing protein [Flavobacteriales bacterium]MBP6699099.1 T9SS type A sorting domain-containing protein [Flavobacteriales bacterium]